MENKHIFLWLVLIVSSLLMVTSVNSLMNLLAPQNYTWSSQNYATQLFRFNFDNVTGIDANCTLYMSQTGGLVNQYGVVNQTSNDPALGRFSFSNSTSNNLTANNANISAGYDSGLYYWNVTCINNSLDVAAGVVTTSTGTRWFLYDATAPYGNITSPSNKSFTNTALIHLNGTINDSYSGPKPSLFKLQFSNSTGDCWQWGNNTWGSCNPTPTTTTPIPGDVALMNQTRRVNSSNFNVSYAVGKNISYITLSDDMYNFVIYAGDLIEASLGSSNYGVINVSFVYDTTPPSADIHSVNLLSNNSWTNSRVIKTNLTVTDRATDHFNISLFDSTPAIYNSTNITTGNATASLFNVTVTADGTYTVNLTAVDNATNKNSTVLLFYTRVDATVPNSTIFSVGGSANNSWFNTRILVINVTAADVNINHFNVTVNATNSTNISTGGVYDTVYNLSVSSDGTYLVGLTTADNATNLNSSPSFYVRVDATVPNATIFSVNNLANNNSWLNTRVWRINMTAADVNINYFNITINATNSTNISTGGVYDTVYNLSVSGGEGVYTINLTTRDNASNINSTAIKIGLDLTSPNSSINNISGKVNNSWTNNRMLAINFTAKDTNTKNWSIYVYNTTDLFNSSPSGWNYTYYESNTSAEVNFSAPRDGTYWFNLTTNDNATNANTTGLFYIRVDATNPSIGTPSFSGISSSGASLSVEMGESNLDSCTYSGGSTGTLTCSGGTCTASLSGLSASIIYSYSVACTDLAGNSATGASNSFITSSASGGGGSGGSGGGSSSGVVGQFTKTVWSSLYAGETAAIKVKEGDGIGVTEVGFKVDKIAYGVIGDVKKVDKTEVPAEIGGKKVHNYLKITVTGAIKEENTLARTVLFKVAKKWLEDNAVSKDKLALYRYADSKWNALPTKITQEDETTIYYSAETPGFSYFAIAESDIAAEAPAPIEEELPIEEAPAVEEPVTESLVEETPASEAPAKASAESKTWLWVVLIVVIAAIIAGIYFWPKKKKGKGF